MDEKKRQILFSGTRPWTSWYNPNWGTDPSLGPSSSGFSSPIQSLETTISRGHAWPSAGRTLTDVGGNFSTIKIKSFDTTNCGIVKSVTRFGHTYQGDQLPLGSTSIMNNALSRVQFTSDLSLNVKGTKAIAQSIPTNPVFDAGTFLGELHEGLPKLVGKELWKSKLKDYRKVGSEYLNVQFGWLPLVSDLQKFGTAVTQSDKILKQLERDSGKNIHRKFTFPDEVVTESGFSNNIAAACGVSVYPYCYVNTGGGRLDWVAETTTKTWFSGCFTYHVDLGDNLRSRMARGVAEARKLYGLELTPETVWNLAPWSWAIDWEGSFGDVLHNVARFSQDGLVMRYGYIMQEKTCKMTYTLSKAGSIQEVSNPTGKILTAKCVAQSKVRRRASPFGFGFDMTALTGRQSAILGALGISRGPRHL